ncbi:MAG: outer rane receptor for ferrienterochelin and colicin [Chitinophagaceae bacterium]|nr:outer rane receptor for ferrienterochelin and colicin [Chitinophagaceae bacterium]
MISLVFLLCVPEAVISQTTTSAISGLVTGSGLPLAGATIVATHEPTGTSYRTQSRTGGRFDISNMNPGGPYSVAVTFVGFATASKKDIHLNLGETYRLEIELSYKATLLDSVQISTTARRNEFAGKGGTEFHISRDKIEHLPTVGRQLADYLRVVPLAKITTSEGGVTIAGQNNRYNAFYVDGAVNKDVFGLSASGTNGGQAAIAPISIDAIDQFQVVISPYDASIGNFTGGGINAITRGGTNITKGSVYYYYRNQDLTGKTPFGPKEQATKLSPFNYKTCGFRLGGAIIKNKLFYFINAEVQRDIRPQRFDFNQYNGNLKGDMASLLALGDTLRKRYNYQPGGFLDNDEIVNADRLSLKFDWNVNTRHKFSGSYRYTKGLRYNTNTSNSTTIHFYNNGYLFPTITHSASFELKSITGKRSNNKLLITVTQVKDDRDPLGQPFPRVSIFDGAGIIVFGTDNSSTQNLLEQSNVSVQDVFRFNWRRHAVLVGGEYELNKVNNVFIQNTFGNYQYNRLADFYNNTAPRVYTVGYPLTDSLLSDATAAAARFRVVKASVFITDEYRPKQGLTITMGLRSDFYHIPETPPADAFTSDSALPKFMQYYDLHGARPGQRLRIPPSVSPRLGFSYAFRDKGVVIRGGVGMFSGRVPLAWPGGIFNNTGVSQGGFTANNSQNAAAIGNIRFRPEPNAQWRPGDLGIPAGKGGLNLVSSTLNMPKLWRTSLAVDKTFPRGWASSLESVFSRNISEIHYMNINILPPTLVSAGPGSRNVYPLPVAIPIQWNGHNPYDHAILLTNIHGPKGFAYNLSFTLDKSTRNDFQFSFSYGFGHSIVMNEASSSVNLSQWRLMETVQGRNYIERSVSDFAQGHRIFIYTRKKFSYARKRFATTISLVYTGQSGAPFSYTYQNSMTRDDGFGGDYDLIYVPTRADLQSMRFLPNPVGGVTYTQDRQRAALDTYIENDRYLRRRRGRFAERNGSRLPFTHVADLKIAQDLNLAIHGKRYQLQLTLDIFNFTNLLNRDWGRTYFVASDQFALLTFAGYVSSTDLTPQYRFNPNYSWPYDISTSTVPAYSARWMGQVGVRFNFN